MRTTYAMTFACLVVAGLAMGTPAAANPISEIGKLSIGLPNPTPDLECFRATPEQESECIVEFEGDWVGGPACLPEDQTTSCRYGSSGRPKEYRIYWQAGSSPTTATCAMYTAPPLDDGIFLWNVNIEGGVATDTSTANWFRASDLSVLKSTAESGSGPSGYCAGYIFW